ncbi:hypothetical protein H3143_01885 [Mycoplasma tullyi]|uniref:Uncharacterized protein n=1 Tax=Mycoplasma tullyi TaxID=1612150 RepID=A0A7D7YDR5_9MOLU|nr:hypothetical protein [Mycoplasma tullyi]QMT98238.1 hypothetical protein H3143_01885 [Mycoplasma tullyi]
MYNLKQTYCTLNFSKQKIDLVLSTNNDQSMHLLRQVSIENNNLYDNNKIINQRLLLQKIQNQIDQITQRHKLVIQKVILNFDALINDLKSKQINSGLINYLNGQQFDNEVKKFVLNHEKSRNGIDQLVNYQVYEYLDEETKKPVDELIENKNYYAVVLVYTSKSLLLKQVSQLLSQLKLTITNISTQELNYQTSQQLKDINDTLMIDILDDHTNISVYLNNTYIINKKINLGINQIKQNVVNKLNAKNKNEDLITIVDQYFNNNLLTLNEDSSYNLLIKTNVQFLSYQYLSKQDLDSCIQKQLVQIIDYINKELELIKRDFKKNIKQIIVNTSRNSAISNNLLNKESELVNDVEISKLYSPKLSCAKSSFIQAYWAIKKQSEFDNSINKIDNYVITPHDYNYDQESDRRAMILSINKELNNILAKISFK